MAAASAALVRVEISARSFLGQRGVEVQEERLDVGAKVGDERYPVRHQPGDEMHVARQPVELGDGDRRSLAVLACLGQRGDELGAAVECV